MKILYVEDREGIRKAISAYLHQDLGHAVTVAKDGKEALDQLLADSAFDLVITDQNMPVMRGLDLLKSLRSDERFKDLTVIVFTSDRSVEEEVQALGGKFILKGDTLKELIDTLAVVAAHLRQKGG